jgi:FkbM family methyltransferase
MFINLPDNHKAFYDSVLINSLTALKLNRHLDNFDARRFNFDGQDHSKEFDAGTHAFFFDWFVKNSEKLFAAYSLLNDEASKRMYLHLIAFRLGGHLSVKLPVHFAGKTKELADYQAMAKYTTSQLPNNGIFGKLRHYDFTHAGHRYVIDCLNLEPYIFRGQYYYAKNGVSIMPEKGDAVLDGGACTGDTSLIFSNSVGEEGVVYALDPVADHLEILDYNVKQFPLKNVKIMPFGVADKNVFAKPIVLNQYAPGFRSGNQTLPMRAIDYLVSAGEIPKLDFIKLDVEGAEMETLRGALQSIGRFKPKLAISLYHKPNDLFDIILFIKEKFPFYQCFVDHYTIHAEETVLYCKA